MKDFFRSLRYLKPYRKRLAVSVVCVLLIAVLWGGGLGMFAPALKVLISAEGLHGWAWNSLTTDRLEGRIVSREGSAYTMVEGQQAATYLDVVAVRKGGAAEEAGIKKHHWIVGWEDRRLMPARDVARYIALAPADTRITLRVFDPKDRQVRTVTVSPAEAGIGPKLLGKVARAIPEPTTRPERFSVFLWVLAVMVAITLLRNLLRFVQEYLVQSAVFAATMDLRCENYSVALRLPVTFFAARGTSDTMSRFIQDTAEIARGMVTLFGKALAEPAKALASVTIAMICSWELTLLALIVGPPAFWLITRLGRIMKKTSRRALEGWSSMLGILEETLTGIRVVKAYTMEGTERKRFFRVNRRLLKQQVRMARIDSAISPSIEAMGIIAGMVAAGVAGYWVLNDRMDGVIFMAWMGALMGMFDPIRKLATVSMRFQRSDAAAARVFELHDQEREKRIPNAPMLPVHSQSLEFVGVHFRYPGAAKEVLRDVNLTVRAGQTLAIVGPNGSGKTTLISLVPRLLEATAGRVFLDGCDVSRYSLRSLRRQIALVTQETVLFNATIADNIAYGLRRPTRQAVLAAARKAFVDEFVRDLPQGYDTMVGERGTTLSGGQRQRITIARAILRDPTILIFDEAMSQIDADSEARIHQAMEEFVRGRTTLLVAHRFATVLSADRIAVMNEGRALDVGTHQELLGRCELYRHLYQTQFADTGG